MNPHYEEAATLCNLANVNTLGLTERQIIAAQAQTQAALALAYEQRTANLMFLYNLGGDDSVIAGIDYDSLLEHIKERLGLA